MIIRGIRISKKLTVTVGAVLLLVGAAMTGALTWTEAFNRAVPIVMTYVLGQSVIDAQKTPVENVEAPVTPVDNS